MLLTACYRETSDDLRTTLDDMIAVFVAWNAAWSLIQDHESDVDYDYTAYAERLPNLVPPERKPSTVALALPCAETGRTGHV